MNREPTVSRDYRIVTVLFELLEGRRSVRSTVRALQDALRGADRELDGFLTGLEERSARAWSAARRRAGGEDGAGGRGAAAAHPAAERAEPDYSAAFAAVAGRAAAGTEQLTAARPRVARELRRLLAMRDPRQRAAVLQSGRRAALRSPLLAEGLLEEACRVRGAAPELAQELTEAAILAARRVHPQHGRGLRWRLEQRAEAHRANVLRLRGELAAADAAWQRIGERVKAEPVDVPDEVAELLSLEASLRIDRREFAAAEALLERAERLYGQVGDREGVARVLLQRGSVAVYAGDPVQAAEHERRAERLLGADADPRLRSLCRTNLADTLVDLGRPVEAAALLTETRDLLNQLDDPAEHLRWRWVEARIARAEERWDDAERRLLEVRNGWLASGRPYDAALATLDLAGLDLARGDWARVRRRAALLAPIFEARGVHREARAALLLFQRAVAAERVSGGLIARLRRYLHFARRDRSLRFDPAADPIAGPAAG